MVSKLLKRRFGLFIPYPDPGTGSWLFTNPRSQSQKCTGSRIRIHNTAWTRIWIRIHIQHSGNRRPKSETPTPDWSAHLVGYLRACWLLLVMSSLSWLVSWCRVPESMLAAAGDVLPLLIGQLVCRVHGLFLAGVEEARTVWQEDAPGQRLKHTPQGIAGRQRASCTDNYVLRGRHLKNVSKDKAHLSQCLRIHDTLVWIRIRGSMPMTNGSGRGSGSIPLTNGSGSGSRRPKNMRIRWIRIGSGLDPQHWFEHNHFMAKMEGTDSEFFALTRSF